MTMNILAPGRIVPLVAVSFGPENDPATPVDPANPLPVRTFVVPAATTALDDTLSATGSRMHSCLNWAGQSC